MKVSIWQQFSSNHSAAFSIVAKFESAEKARAVAKQVTEMLLETYRWKEHNLSRFDLSPVQIRHLFEHKVAIGTTWMLSEGHLRKALQVIGDTILVADEPGYSNFDGSDRAFIKLFERFGGDVVAAQEERDGLYLSLSGDAEDENTAKEAFEHIHKRSYKEKSFYFHTLDPEFEYEAGEAWCEGKRLHFEQIFAWTHFFELSSWYAFAKASDLSNITARFRSERDAKEITVELDAANVKRLFWDAFDYHKERPKVELAAIAEFISPEMAAAAAEKIREMLLKIQTWSRANPEESRAIWELYWERLSPIEEALKLEYGIEWPLSVIEWIHDCKESADFILVQMGHQVLLGNQKDYFVGVSPFPQLLEKMKGFKGFNTDYRRILILTLPINRKAEVLCDEIKAAVETVVYPWMPYYRGYENFEGWKVDLEKLKQHDERALKAIEMFHDFIDSGELKIEYELTDFLQKLYTLPPFFEEEIQRLNRIVRDCEFGYWKMFIRDNQIHIEGGGFYEAASYLGFEAFVKWLNSKGTKVSYSAGE